LILRRAVEADRPAVVALAMTFFEASTYSAVITVDPGLVGLQFDMALETGVVFVAERDDIVPPGGPELVGFLALVPLIHLLSGDRYAEEMAWFVGPRYRSGTVGPRLLRRAEEWARENGCVFLRMAAPHSTDVGRFYETQGYQAIETAYLKRVV
jgi:GNAT superfamily N-acetyltransferase